MRCLTKENFFNRPRLPPRRYPSSSSPAPSDSAVFHRPHRKSDAYDPRAAVLPREAATSEDRTRSNCGSGWTRSSPRYLHPRLGVGAHRAVGVCGTSRTRWCARAMLGLDSGIPLRSEVWRAKRCERRQQVARKSLTVSAHEGWRCAQGPSEASRCYDV